MPYCSKCGAEVSVGSAFCPKCGQAQGGPPSAPPTALSGLTENVAGLLCYVLGWITGLIFFFVDNRPYVRFHAAQSIVTFGGLHVLNLVLAMLFGWGWVFRGPRGWTDFTIGFGLHHALQLLGLILWVLCMVKAYQGERFKLPIAGEIAEGFARK